MEQLTISQKAISVRNLSKIYKVENGTFVALGDINFDIKEGERVGVIGSNGAGKSTLLAILSGFAGPTEGTVKIEGRINSILDIGASIQPEMTGRENLYLGGEMQGLSHEEIEAKIPEIIDFVDIGRYIDLPTRTYSSGMKARLSFGIVTYVQPEILIVDEALGVGDADFAKKSEKKMRELCEKGKILIMVSHSMAAICQFTDRCLWINHGKIMQDGPSRDVTKAYEQFLRKLEEDKLKKALQVRMKKNTFSGSAMLSSLSLSTHPNGEERLLFDVLEDICFNIEIVANEQLVDVDVCVEIFSVDSTRLMRQSFSQKNDFFSLEKDKKYSVFMRFLRCGLAAGTYEYVCTVLSQGKKVAQKLQVFEMCQNPKSIAVLRQYYTESIVLVKRKK